MAHEVKELIELPELKIGNYLLYKGEIVHVTSLSLDIDDEYEDTIGFCKLGETSNEIAAWNRALANDLERIPITQEYLYKLGFEKSTTSPYNDCEAFIIFKDAGRLVWCAGDIFKPLSHGFVRITNYDIISNPNPIKYIHCLQNLIHGLTGQELKVIQ